MNFLEQGFCNGCYEPIFFDYRIEFSLKYSLLLDYLNNVKIQVFQPFINK